MVKNPFLVIALVMLPFLVGCSTTTVQYDGPCPLRPELTPVPIELQLEISPHALAIIAENQLKLKKAIKDLEVLSGCEIT